MQPWPAASSAARPGLPHLTWWKSVCESPKKLTSLAERFLQPTNATHRQYEALRAYFVDGLPGRRSRRRFGYTHGSFRVLAPPVPQGPRPPLLPHRPAKGPHPRRPQEQTPPQQVIALRKQNLSIYDISRALAAEGHRPQSRAPSTRSSRTKASPACPAAPTTSGPPAPRPPVADVADVRQLDLTPRHVHTKFGGLFLFLPTLADLPFDRIIARRACPARRWSRRAAPVRSLLALKLFGNARHSHVMSYVLDEGLALFAGLNVIPKRSFLTEYSCRIDPPATPTGCGAGSTP